MATEEATNVESPTASPEHQQQHQQSSLPNYAEMIMNAIESLNEKNGSNKSTISKHIESTHPNLPAAHSTLLSHHLNKLKQTGQLVMVKNNYMKPDPNAPPKRGRGRPPKPKSPTPPGSILSMPRPRGRPPKPKDPFVPSSDPKAPVGSGRPRGRPPKKAKTDDGGPAPPAPAVPPPASSVPEKRGRGRPPKVKPAVPPVGC